jgi:hypothetical protein
MCSRQYQIPQPVPNRRRVVVSLAVLSGSMLKVTIESRFPILLTRAIPTNFLTIDLDLETFVRIQPV